MMCFFTFTDLNIDYLCCALFLGRSAEKLGMHQESLFSCSYYRCYHATRYSLFDSTPCFDLWQLKDMAERVPEGNMSSVYGSNHVSDSLGLSSIENTRSNFLASQAPESIGDSSNLELCNGNRMPPEEAEWVEQAEPGVYITVSSLPGGDKYLKRVRFRYGQFF